MKKALIALTLIAFTGIATMAQIKEGHVKFEVNLSTDNPAMEMAVAMMDGATMEISFKNELTLTKMNMGTMMNIATTTNSKSNEVLICMGGMMGKKAIKTTLEDLKEQQPEEANLDVKLVNETKEIQGYKCKKAVITAMDGKEAIFWYTEEIEINKAGQSYLNDQIPGFPMEFEINQGGMKMSMKATLFEKKISGNASELFSMEIPAGYQEMSLDAMKSMGM